MERHHRLIHVAIHVPPKDISCKPDDYQIKCHCIHGQDGIEARI
jgi:hypothetical protein